MTLSSAVLRYYVSTHMLTVNLAGVIYNVLRCSSPTKQPRTALALFLGLAARPGLASRLPKHEATTFPPPALALFRVAARISLEISLDRPLVETSKTRARLPFCISKTQRRRLRCCDGHPAILSLGGYCSLTYKGESCRIPQDTT